MQSENNCWAVDLGLVHYEPACRLQNLVARARKEDAIPDVLLLCEHPHVITLGRNGKAENLRASKHVLTQMNVEFHSSDRGGDITYHGPGQIVGYPVVDLTMHRRDVRWYVERLEEVMIRATADFALSARRSDAGHGIWLEDAGGERKLASLGVHLSRWVTSHGFAYNVRTDLRYFDLIVPCGLAGKRVTSLEAALGRTVSMEAIRSSLVEHFGTVFARRMVAMSSRDFEESLAERGVRLERGVAETAMAGGMEAWPRR